MALLSTWSRRKREAEKAASGLADVYYYHAPSGKLREQVRQHLNSIVQEIDRLASLSVYEYAVRVLRKELGRPELVNDYSRTYEAEFSSFLLNEKDVDEWLTGLEIIIRTIEHFANQRGRSWVSNRSISELNAWMREDAFSYQFEGSTLVQMSNQFAHSELVVPALNLLSDKRFVGANEEFRKAHAEFRAGDFEDSIHDCCNAFESVLKVILDGKGWPYESTDSAKKLLDVAFENSLIPSHMQSSFTGLRTILESGVPTVRNKNAGHGSGAQVRNIPEYIAAFQIHQTAAAILLLVEASR